MNSLFVALTLGFLGSFHCVAMCGPIALALPLNRNSVFSKGVGALLYNAGRIITYLILGSVFGLLGQSIVIAGYQQALSITLGVLILLGLLLPAAITNKINFMSLPVLFIGKLKQKLRTLFNTNSHASLFLIGTLNGLLPCGLVYLGIAGSIASGNALQGGMFMLVFGFGTLPAMLLLALAGQSISIDLRKKINKAIPVFIATMALLLIVRGMNLGIPYLSPEMSTEKPVCSKCCHK